MFCFADMQSSEDNPDQLEMQSQQLMVWSNFSWNEPETVQEKQ